jgi:hypothetical protein
MSDFFYHYPSTYYTFDDENIILGTNIISRFIFQEKFKNNPFVFYEYKVKEEDTPEILAYKLYGSVEKHWIILLFNNILDVQYDWPLSYHNFIEFVDKKYSSPNYADTSNTSISGLSWAMNVNNVHSYYKIIDTNVSTGDSYSQTIKIDEFVYANTPSSEIQPSIVLGDNNIITETITRNKKTYYEYEKDINESKSKIKLVKPELIPTIMSEFKRVISL